MSWEERTICHPPQPSPSSPNEGTSVEGQLWEHGERAIVQEPVTSALNASRWQFGHLNEGMTPKQCHAAHCNSQQVEGSVGWDRHSSDNLRNRQMDGQDEGSKRIYITREISRRGGRQFGRHQEVLLVEYQKRKRRIHPRTRPEDGPWPSPQLRRWRSCSPRILPDRWRSPHKGPVLKPASLPNSLYWACWVWVRSHLQWDPQKTGPYNWRRLWGELGCQWER